MCWNNLRFCGFVSQPCFFLGFPHACCPLTLPNNAKRVPQGDGHLGRTGWVQGFLINDRTPPYVRKISNQPNTKMLIIIHMPLYSFTTMEPFHSQTVNLHNCRFLPIQACENVIDMIFNHLPHHHGVPKHINSFQTVAAMLKSLWKTSKSEIEERLAGGFNPFENY